MIVAIAGDDSSLATSPELSKRLSFSVLNWSLRLPASIVILPPLTWSGLGFGFGFGSGSGLGSGSGYRVDRHSAAGVGERVVPVQAEFGACCARARMRAVLTCAFGGAGSRSSDLLRPGAGGVLAHLVGRRGQDRNLLAAHRCSELSLRREGKAAACVRCVRACVRAWLGGACKRGCGHALRRASGSW